MSLTDCLLFFLISIVLIHSYTFRKVLILNLPKFPFYLRDHIENKPFLLVFCCPDYILDFFLIFYWLHIHILVTFVKDSFFYCVCLACQKYYWITYWQTDLMTALLTDWLYNCCLCEKGQCFQSSCKPSFPGKFLQSFTIPMNDCFTSMDY